MKHSDEGFSLVGEILGQDSQNSDDQGHDDAGGIESYLDLDGDGKVSVSESAKAEAELLEAYAEDRKTKGGVQGKLAAIFSRMFRAIGKK